MSEGGFTDAVKQELAQLPIGGGEQVRAELASLIRFAGALVVPGGGGELVVDLESSSGATARRAFALIQDRYGHRPQLRVRAAGGVQRRTHYGVRLQTGGADVAQDLGLVDPHGRPVDHLLTPADDRAAVAGVRGAFLAAGSLSAPNRPPHLEIAAHTATAAQDLAGLLGRVSGGNAGVPAGEPGRRRVVLKSGAAIGELLLTLGATGAYLRWDEFRLRGQLRREATRLTNADAANVRRAVEAASSQVRAVETVVRQLGWEALEEDLRAVALARLANPDASLAEIGELADPPCSKSAVHRRLRRLEALADGLGAEEGRS